MRQHNIDILEDIYDTIVGNDNFCTVEDFQQRHIGNDILIDYDNGVIDLGTGYYIKVGKFIQ